MCKNQLIHPGRIFVVLCLIFSAYSNTLTSPPVLDDFHSFVTNPSTHVEKIDTEILGKLAGSYFGVWRFLPMLSLAFDFWWGDGSIIAFHVSNIMIHILCFVCCYWFSGALLNAASTGSSNGPYSESLLRPFTLAVSSLWALHPVQTSAVTYIVQRMASLQALFFFAACAAYIHFKLAWRERRKIRQVSWALLCAVSSLGAFLSKENSAMLPVFFLLIELWFFKCWTFQSFARKVSMLLSRRKWMPWVAISTLGLGLMSVTAFEHFASGYNGRHFTMTERLLTECRIILQYAYAIIVPNPGNLSLEHDVVVSKSLLSPPTTLISILTIVFFVALSLRVRSSYPIFSFGIMWFLLNLIIESSIVPLELKFDHRMYLPSFGLILSLVEIARQVGVRLRLTFPAKDRQKVVWSGLAIACAILALLSFTRNEDWQDILTINRDAVHKAPEHPRAHANYAVALSRAGRYDEAILEAKKAIELGQKGLESHFVAAGIVLSAYMHQGRWEEAIREGEKLFEERPEKFDAMSLPVFYLKLAECYRMVKNYHMAYNYVMLALDIVRKNERLKQDEKWAYLVLESVITDASTEDVDVDGDGSPDPGNMSLYEWVAITLYRAGDYDGAKIFGGKVAGSSYISSILHEIDICERRNRLQSKQWDFDIKEWTKESNATDIILWVSYAIRKKTFLKTLMPFGEKVAAWCAKIDPYNPYVYTLQGWYAFEKNDVEAVTKAKQAVALAPQSAKAWIALGFFEQRAGRLENALTAFRQTLELYPGYPKRHILKDLMAQLEAQMHAQTSESATIAQAALQ